MNLLKSKKDFVFFFVLIILAIAVIVVGGVFIFGLNKVASINSFDECAKYYPVQEIFPERCTTKDGKTFVKNIDPQEIELTGEIICLPHRDKNGAQTLECAIGLQVGDIYYGLQSPNNSDPMLFQNGKQITVKGKFTPNTDPNEKYDIVGTINVESFKESN